MVQFQYTQLLKMLHDPDKEFNGSFCEFLILNKSYHGQAWPMESWSKNYQLGSYSMAFQPLREDEASLTKEHKSTLALDLPAEQGQSR